MLFFSFAYKILNNQSVTPCGLNANNYAWGEFFEKYLAWRRFKSFPLKRCNNYCIWWALSYVLKFCTLLYAYSYTRDLFCFHLSPIILWILLSVAVLIRLTMLSLLLGLRFLSCLVMQQLISVWCSIQLSSLFSTGLYSSRWSYSSDSILNTF